MKIAKIILLFTIITLCSFTGCGKKDSQSSDKSSQETGTLTDIDGNIYSTIKIGEQWWMAENLKVTNDKDGNPVTSFCYGNDPANSDIYGRLYTWGEAMKAAPAGWHVPSIEEWNTLIDYLGGAPVAGGKMKETGNTHWHSPNSGATNESGFTALPGGFRGADGIFYTRGQHADFWSSSGSGPNAWCIYLYHNAARVQQGNDLKGGLAFSVRCIKNN